MFQQGPSESVAGYAGEVAADQTPQETRIIDTSDLQGSRLERADRVEAYVESVAWVVRLTLGKDRQVIYVRARTESGAIDTARWHSTMPRKADAYAHKAHPKELGCVEVKA